MKKLQSMQLSAFLGVCLVLTGCRPAPDFEALKQEILDLHRQSQAAHWNKDIGYFTSNLSNEYFSVGQGDIKWPTHVEITSQFTDYLRNTRFTEYRDLREPLVGFSNDGSVAWLVGRMKAAGRTTMGNKGEREMEFVCAWVTLYERKNGKWLKLGEVSSFE